MAAGGFGECPRCGKLTLVQMLVDRRSEAYIAVECVNCGFKKEVLYHMKD